MSRQEDERLVITFKTRKVLDDSRVPEDIRNNLKIFSMITWSIITTLLLILPFLVIILSSFKSFSDVLTFLSLYLYLGPIALFIYLFFYPFWKGYVSLGRKDIRFRSTRGLRPVNQRMVDLRFADIRKITFRDEDLMVVFELSDKSSKQLVTMGMERRELEVLKERLRRINGVEFVQVNNRLVQDGAPDC